MDNINNIDTIQLAEKLYKLACDFDFADYTETSASDINEIENALYNLKNYAVLNPTANKNYLTLLCCLDRIANYN